MQGDELREQLILQIDAAIAWRFDKADRQPGNQRHERSAQALMRVREFLNQVPITDQVFIAYSATYYWPPPKDDRAFSAQIESQVSVEDAFIRHYGYDEEETGDGWDFLKRLSEFLQAERSDSQ